MIYTIKNFYTVNPIRKQWLKKIIDRDYENDIGVPGYFSFPITNRSKFFKDLYEKYLVETKKLFGEYTLDSSNKDTIWCYRSKLTDYHSVWHDHINTSTINAVYYFQINKGDSVSFNNNGIIENYEMDENELIIMPNYLIHRPNSPVGNKVRYSLNMEIKTKQSVHKVFKCTKFGTVMSDHQ
jgi:hypothetical protein